MKKLLTCLFAMLSIIFSASATDIYLAGSMNNWSSNNSNYKFKPINGDDNHQELTIQILEGSYEFKIVDGGKWNGANQGITINGNRLTLGDGSGNNISLKVSSDMELKFDYYREYSGSPSVQVTGKSVTIPKVTTWRIHGQFPENNWNSIQFVQNATNNNLWEATFCPQRATGSFGIAMDINGIQDTWYNNSANDMLSETNTTLSFRSNGSGNPQFSLDEKKEYTFTWNTSNNQLSITWEETPIEPEPDPDPVTYKIYFDNTAGWDVVNIYTYGSQELYPWPGKALEKNSEGLYYWEYTSTTKPNFNVIFNNNDNGFQTPDNVVFEDGKTYNNGGWNLNGQMLGSNAGWNAQSFTSNGDGTFSLKTDVTYNDGQFTLYDDFGNHYKPSDQNTKLEIGQDVILNTKDADNGKYFLSNGTYTFTWNPATKILHVSQNIEYPETMFVYGHINNLYWSPNNNVEMKATETPGVFTAEFVEISGQWNAYDIEQKPTERKEFDSTGDENYIAFFDHEIKNQDDFGSTPKYTTTYTGKDNNEQISTEHNVANLLYGEGGNNFHVPEGIYNITVDLTNMTVTFVEVEKKTVELVWYQGGHGDYAEATMLPEKSQDEHSLVFGDENPDILQVGVGTNPTHRVARMVEYTVWYKAPVATSSAKAVKRYAGDNETDYKVLGYNEATPSTTDDDGNITELGDYTIIGSSDYSDNHLIQLNKAGDYAIIASVNVDQKELVEYNPVEDNVLLVSVAQAEAVVYFQDQSAPFPAEEDAATLALSFSKDVLDKDFTISIKAKDNATGWERPSNSNDLDASYQTALTKDLYNQLKDLGGIDVKVDGFYLEGKETVNAKYVDNLKYDVLVDVPCSGVYEVTVAPVDGGNYTFKAVTSEISIYPNLKAQFGKEKGFNIEFYTFGDNGNLNFPAEDDKFKDYLSSLNAYIPGSYFVSYLSTDQNEIMTTSVEVGDYRDKYSDTCKVDLSDITTMGEVGMPIDIYVTKNGASGTHAFTVVSSKDGNVSTSVEGIVAEDGEATYYTLQGVKVDNPEKGIYIKVVNGKASKVLVK